MRLMIHFLGLMVARTALDERTRISGQELRAIALRMD
jgi:hypothetical protein